MKNHARHIISELKEHLPYITGIIILGFLIFAGKVIALGNIAESSRSLFHIFHPIHLLLSATVTTAMFWYHEKRFLKAVIKICSISRPLGRGALLLTRKGDQNRLSSPG